MDAWHNQKSALILMENQLKHMVDILYWKRNVSKHCGCDSGYGNSDKGSKVANPEVDEDGRRKQS